MTLPSPMPPTFWRVLPLSQNSAAMNMAIDEVISESVASGVSPPTIRFYTWMPSAVSIGYFQSLHQEVDVALCQQKGIDIVRRRTGGGAVYHDTTGEITYSVIAPESLFSKDIIQSYREICGWIIRSLALLGIQASFHPINDILVGGRKISGNAQTRRGSVLLQHGTILYDLDLDTMFSVLRVGKEKLSDKQIQDVRQRVTKLLDHGEFSREQLYDSLMKGFVEGKEWTVSALTPEEHCQALTLAEEKYKNKLWNERR